MKSRIEKKKAVGKRNEWDLDSRIAMIQMLIPIGLKAVQEELEFEVSQLVGNRYSRKKGELRRWGKNPGSVYLGDQKVSVEVPRVRDCIQGMEKTLQSYKALQNPKVINEAIFKRLINGISTRKYERAVESIPETFGIKKSSVSRKFIRVSAKKLQTCLERSLRRDDIVAIFIDGKFLGDNEAIIALGVTTEGEKIVLGFVESSVENHRVCKEFMNSLRERGLNVGNEILFIIDGSKGLHKGIKEAFGAKAIIQRCQWHKRENVIGYLDKNLKLQYRRKLQSAYNKPTYQTAKRSLLTIRRELKLINQSAANSLDEGLEETLTLHRLGMASKMKLGISFTTTNCIETINRQLEIYAGRITNWRSSEQRRRWVGSALMEIEPNCRKAKGFRFLEDLRIAMMDIAILKGGQNAA